jgi:hypothetical protein
MHHVVSSTTVLLRSGAVDGRRTSTFQGDHPGSVFEFGRCVTGASSPPPAMRDDRLTRWSSRVVVGLPAADHRVLAVESECRNDRCIFGDRADRATQDNPPRINCVATITTSSQPIVGAPCATDGFKNGRGGRYDFQPPYPRPSRRLVKTS